MQRPTLEPAELLAHAAWLRRLAQVLVGADAADDLVQETYRAALEAAPRADEPVRPWLATVLRNFARLRWRADIRRGRRERAAVDGTAAIPTPEQLLAQHEAQRLVAAAVAALTEPYRSTVLLCYGEGLTPAQVARHLGVLPGTVRWRLKRGLDLVRERLDAAHEGDRRRWCALLLPLSTAGVGPAPVLATGGLVLMKLKWVLSIGVLLLLLSTLAWRRAGDGGAPEAAAGRANAARVAAQPGRPLPTLAPARLATPPAETGLIAGQVRDERGQSVAGALVAAIARVPIHDITTGRSAPGPVMSTLTDARGRYQMRGLALGDYGVTANARGFQPAHRGPVTLATAHADARDVDLVLAVGGATLRGRVLDVGGGAIAGARLVAIALLGELRDLDPTRVATTVAGADGRYLLSLRAGAAHALLVDADGYGQARVALAAARDERRDVTLRPAAEIAGRVVADDGAAVARAEVTLARDEQGAAPLFRTEVADAEGGFRVRNLVPGRFRLWARKGQAAGRAAIDVGEAERVAGVRIVLARAPSVSGQVRSGDGPLAGAEIWFERIEGAVAQAPLAASAHDGTFRIDGVLPATYDVRASARGFLPARRSVNVAATHVDQVDFTLEPDVVLSGTVVSGAGAPAAGARVLAFTWDSARGLNRGVRETRANDQGRFQLDGLAGGEVTIGGEDPAVGIARARRLTLAPGSRQELTLTLEPGARATGRVRRADGSPAPSAVVTLFQGARGWGVRRVARTGPDGAFVLGALANGATRIYAATEELAVEPAPGGRPVPITIQMAGGQDAAGLELVLPIDP